MSQSSDRAAGPSSLQEAIRKAKGELTGPEVEDAIRAFNRGQRGEGTVDVKDLGGGRYAMTRKSP